MAGRGASAQSSQTGSAVEFEWRAMEKQNFFGLEGLTDLGVRNRIDMRPTLLRVLTDLYVHRFSHTPHEERHYTELALRLLEAVDTSTRVAVAKRFSRYLSPPLRVLRWLARDVPEVAAELRAHPLLQPPALTGEAPADTAATSIADGDISREKQHRGDPSGVIDPITAIELNDLFFAAAADARRLILLNLPIVAPVPAGRVRVLGDRSISQRLEAAALSGKREDFAHHLAGALLISREQARRIVRDERGEPVVVAGKALSVPRDVLYRILMFVNPVVGHSVERVYALAALYDELTAAGAEGMLAIWQAAERSERAKTEYRPLAWDDEARRRARPGAAVHHSAGAPRINERRSAS
jgi:hypothetical protein